MTNEAANTRERIETALRALEQRDAVAAASTYAADGVYIDPQFPEPAYEGRETIRKAFEWGFTNLVAEPDYTIRHFLDGDHTCAVEVDTNHRGIDGSTHSFQQVFVVEVDGGGIRRWQTYLPFPPE